ncbi:MAG TPA: hypothetical protein VFV95_00755 [Vicinamibacterales bacterium]|nr:hypothetical protein [Vicinamibacterales bacterium]
MTRVFSLLLAGVLITPAAAFAQVAVQIPDSERALEAQSPNDARRVQMELRRLLNEHPPSLRIVLQADPSLIERPDYLAPYPRVAAFLKQHPEIARNPGFFFGQSDFGWYARDQTPQERATEALQAILAGVAAFTVAMALLFAVASLVRQAFGYRRWLRQSRVQTEVHTKILDRLQSNEELLAYIQTPAGQRFLELGPSPKREPEPRVLGAPLGRILWGVQAGVMLLALGIGFWLVQRNAIEDLAPAFGAMGTLAAVLGAGAICSSALAYVLSARLGLLPARE